MDSDVLHVQMFSTFTLTYKNVSIRCDNNRSKRIWALLAYLIYHRGKTVSSDELMSLLWSSDKSDNPAGAMKTALHRARALLDTLYPGAGHNMLLYKNGGYSWNTDIPAVIDTDEFEALLSDRQASDAESANEAARYSKALSLYVGDFLSMQSSETWVMPIQTYYRNLYVEALSRAMPILQKEGQLREAADFCRRAIQIDPYEEEFYRHLMRCLLALDQRADVVTVYEDMSKLLLSTFGVMPDQESRSLYREALRTVNTHVLAPETLLEQLTEAGTIRGALLCDYDFFKMLYQAKARMLARSGDAIHIVLLTLQSRQKQNFAKRSIELAMDNLEEHLCTALRKGDVISRCSASQFVIMLPQANYENSCMVCRRFIESFEKKYPHSPIRIDFFVHSLTPSTTN